MIPNYQLSDIISAMRQMLPSWLAWSDSPTSIQQNLIAGLAPTHYRVTQEAINMIADLFPATCGADMVGEWQASLLLPDPNMPAPATLAAKQAQIVARLVMNGGASVAFFQNYVGTLLGISPSLVVVTQYFPFVVGFNKVYSPVSGATAGLTWNIHLPAGSNVALVQAELTRIIPAYSILTVTSG